MKMNSSQEKEINKEAAKKPKPLRYYDVKIEVTMPGVLMYRVLADSPEAALEKALRNQPVNVRPNLARARKIKAMIYESGSMVTKLVKNLMGR